MPKWAVYVVFPNDPKGWVSVHKLQDNATGEDVAALGEQLMTDLGAASSLKKLKELWQTRYNRVSRVALLRNKVADETKLVSYVNIFNKGSYNTDYNSNKTVVFSLKGTSTLNTMLSMAVRNSDGNLSNTRTAVPGLPRTTNYITDRLKKAHRTTDDAERSRKRANAKQIQAAETKRRVRSAAKKQCQGKERDVCNATDGCWYRKNTCTPGNKPNRHQPTDKQIQKKMFCRKLSEKMRELGYVTDKEKFKNTETFCTQVWKKYQEIQMTNDQLSSVEELQTSEIYILLNTYISDGSLKLKLKQAQQADFCEKMTTQMKQLNYVVNTKKHRFGLSGFCKLVLDEYLQDPDKALAILGINDNGITEILESYLDRGYLRKSSASEQQKIQERDPNNCRKRKTSDNCTTPCRGVTQTYKYKGEERQRFACLPPNKRAKVEKEVVVATIKPVGKDRGMGINVNANTKKPGKGGKGGKGGRRKRTPWGGKKGKAKATKGK